MYRNKNITDQSSLKLNKAKSKNTLEESVKILKESFGEEEIKAMMGRAYSGCGDFAELDKADITFARAIERVVLERAAEVCKEVRAEMVMSKFPDTDACFWARASADTCYEAIRTLLPKEES